MRRFETRRSASRVRAGTLTSALLLMGGAFLALPAAATAAQTQYYVDQTTPSCSDTGLGTADAPFCTITKGVAVLQPGSTLYIGAGSYAETVKPAVSGTANAPVTITRWPGRSPTIAGSPTYGAYIVNRAFVVLSDLTFTGTALDGIYVSGSDHIQVTGNVVTHAGQPRQGATAPGISLRSSTASTVSGNTSDDNSDHGILVSGTSTGDTITGNEASRNANGWRRNANGIDVVAPGNTILRNVLHDNEDSGLQFYTGGNDNLAALNVSYNNGDHGIDDLNVTGGRLIGNTIYHNCTTGINVEGTSGSYTIENNIAVDNAVYPAYDGIACTRRTGNIGVWDSAPPSTTVNHNLVWLSRAGTLYVFGSGYSTLAAMQKATGQEAAGVQADPRFAGQAGGNLQLTAGSPAEDRGDSGVPGAQDHDLLGNVRVRDPAVDNSLASGPRLYDDLGAYEYQPGATSPPTAPTALLTVTPSTGTAPLQVTADASASTDPQGQTLSYAFDFGDGAVTGTQSSPTATHTYPAAGTYVLTVTVTDSSGLSSSAARTVTGTTTSAVAPTFVSSIATNFSTNVHTSGSVTVWRSGGVAAGDLVVLTLQLSGTSATGTVSATDTAGNAYSQAATVSDGSGNRLVLLTGVATRALAVNDKVTATFPSSATYRLIGDELSGVTQLDRAATATGTASTFSSGPAQATVGNDIAFGAVSVPSTTAAPGWATGWRSVGAYAVGSQYLSRAYQVPVAGSQTATGTAGGPWLAAALTLRQ
jgi:parallel beta-helix repeat protein